MNTADEKVILRLYGLIDAIFESYRIFYSAHEKISDHALRTQFVLLANQRSEYIRELNSEIIKLGGDVTRSSKILNIINKEWNTPVSFYSNDNPDPILKEIDAHEDKLQNTYKNALNSGFPLSIMNIVSQQYENLISAQENIKKLRGLEIGDLFLTKG